MAQQQSLGKQELQCQKKWQTCKNYCLEDTRLARLRAQIDLGQ